MKLLEIISSADDFKVIVTALGSALGAGKLWGYIQKRQEARDAEIERARQEVRDLLKGRIEDLKEENKKLKERQN
ncbi:MAG: hypothetical protein ACYS71_07955 [Planctomycetota bacterium]|jgi:hypothetical protein